MSYLWHAVMSYAWAVLVGLGIVIGGILWVGMAIWDAVRRAFRRLDGEAGDDQDPAGS
jgi:hypothetical protein